MDLLRILYQKYGDPAYLLPKNMGDSFSLVINLMVSNYFWNITKMNPEKMAIAENLYSPRNGKLMLQILDPKMAFK